MGAAGRPVSETKPVLDSEWTRLGGSMSDAVTCTLRVNAVRGSCQLDAPGQPTESWSAFFVAQYTPVPPHYVDMQLQNGLDASSVGASGSRVYNVQFTATNREAAAHPTEVWPVIDPDPGPVPAQPAGVVPVGGAVSYNATISFPPALRGATVTIKAVIGDRASGRFSPLPPTEANPIHRDQEHRVNRLLAGRRPSSSWADNVDHSCILNQDADSEPLMLQTTGHPGRRQPTVSLRRLSSRRAGTCRRR